MEKITWKETESLEDDADESWTCEPFGWWTLTRKERKYSLVCFVEEGCHENTFEDNEAAFSWAEKIVEKAEKDTIEVVFTADDLVLED